MDIKIKGIAFILFLIAFAYMAQGATETNLIILDNFTAEKNTSIWDELGDCSFTGDSVINCTGIQGEQFLRYIPANLTNFKIITRLAIQGANPAFRIYGQDNNSDYYRAYIQGNNGQNDLKHFPDNTQLASNTTITWTGNTTYEFSYIDGNITLLMRNDSNYYYGGYSIINSTYSNGSISLVSEWTDKYYYIDYVQIYSYDVLPNEYCYQGTANGTSDYDGSCNVVYTYGGDYSTDASTNPSYAYDANFDTYASGTPYYFHVNYTHPSGNVLFSNATWLVSLGWKEPISAEQNVSLNYSIDQACLTTSPVKLRMDYFDNGGSNHGYNFTCWDYNAGKLKSMGQQITGETSIRLAEEGIVWNATTNVDVDNCTAYTFPLYNFTIRDEATKAWLSPITNDTLFNVEFNLSYNNLNLNYSQSFSQINPITICSQVDLGTFPFIEYLTASYSADGYVNEFYFIDNGTTRSGVKQIDLHSLPTADSTSFLFNYFDRDGLIIDDIIVHTFRKYIGEGVFREIERSKQNAEGNTILHLVEEDVIYYFQISLQNRTLFVSNTYTALCDSVPCTIILEESGAFQDFTTDWDLVDDGGYRITKDVLDRNINLTFSTSSSSTFNMTIYALDSDGEYSAVSSGEKTGTSGEIIVNIPQASGNTTFFGAIYKDGDFLKSEWIDLEEDAGVYFGTDLAIFLAIIIILALGLMAVDNKEMSIVFIIVGALIAGIYGLIDWHDSQGLPLLIYVVIDGGIIAYKLSRRNR